MAEAVETSIKDDVYDDGYFHVEHRRFYVSCGGKPVYTLSRTEFLILSLLLREQGRIVENSEIWRFAWGGKGECNRHSLRVHIAHLRHKLGPFGVAFQSMPGVGYRLLISHERQQAGEQAAP